MKSKNNKELVRNFYKHIVRDRDSSLINNYVHANYIQHSPKGKDGRQGLLEMVAFLKTLPPATDQTSPIKQLIAQDDLVVVRLELHFMGNNIMVIELFKLVDGMLAEHWDVTQELSNNDTPFINVEVGAVCTDRNAFIRQHYDKARAVVHHLVEEDDHLAVHAEVKQYDQRLALFDIYHFNGSKLSGHWAVKQVVPANMPHNNGMF